MTLRPFRWEREHITVGDTVQCIPNMELVGVLQERVGLSVPQQLQTKIINKKGIVSEMKLNGNICVDFEGLSITCITARVLV